MEIDERGSEKSLSFCCLKIDNVFCVSRLTREGSGNFLILTYQKLRELEFEILKFLKSTNQLSLFDISSKVYINQFYGIEYEAFASEIAKISLLLMKHLMDRKVSNYFGQNIIDFPIKENANIVNGNALRIEWEKVDYILGNPPFLGKKFMSSEQKEDLISIFPKGVKTGILDYITAWFYKASLKAREDANLRIAFVSTNSITQGEQVAILWKPILEDMDCKIDFAYQSFKWTNEAKGKAGVYCIIIGFSRKFKKKRKYIFNGETVKEVNNINGYLLEGDNTFIKSITNSICNMPVIKIGNNLIDNGNYIIVPEICSENKSYMIVGFSTPEIICSNLVHLIDSDNLTLFGILSSSTHMSWIKVVAGRLGNGYRYSSQIVYNNFPFIELKDSLKEKIDKTAQQLIRIRDNYFKENWSLADLYNPVLMPIDLRKAHQENDRAVWEAYGKNGSLEMKRSVLLT